MTAALSHIKHGLQPLFRGSLGIQLGSPSEPTRASLLVKAFKHVYHVIDWSS